MAEYEFKIKITGAEGRGGWQELFFLLKDWFENQDAAKLYDIFEPIGKTNG